MLLHNLNCLKLQLINNFLRNDYGNRSYNVSYGHAPHREIMINLQADGRL